MANAQQLRFLVFNQDPKVIQYLRESPVLAQYIFEELEAYHALLGKLRDGAFAGLIIPFTLPGISGLDLVRLLRGDPFFTHLMIGLVDGRHHQGDMLSQPIGLGPTFYLKDPLDASDLALYLERLASINPLKEGGASSSLRLGPIELDLERYEFKLKNKPMQLTPIEFKLLKLFIERKGRIQTREHLLNTIWGYTTEIESRTIDTHIRRLREKLQEEASRIQTVRGVGYKLLEDN